MSASRSRHHGDDRAGHPNGAIVPFAAALAGSLASRQQKVDDEQIGTE